MIYFKYDGKDGENGIDGANGKNATSSIEINGVRGDNGTQGKSGQNGQDLILKLQADENRIEMIEMNKNNKISYLDFSESINKGIILTSRGAKGGKGGKGGNGGQGRDGDYGRDATQTQEGTDGKKGGDGGWGGDGGKGGNGGNGGDIQVLVKSEDMDLLMLVEEYHNDGGKGGQGGDKGYGGKAGKGGKGGKSYHWSELGQDNQYLYYSNKGGESGSDGNDGLDGRKGEQGLDGKKGQFYFKVEDQKYYSLYNVKVETVEKATSDDDIIEPGEQLHINSIVFRNNGGMPTPTHQRVIIGLKSNDCIQFNQNDYVFITQSIQNYQSYRLQQPLIFQIKDFKERSVNTVFKKQTKLNYQATLERINRTFNDVSKISTDYLIQFPVEISKIQVLSSIKFNEEAPFAFSITNRSSKPIGFETEQKRLLNVRVILKNDKQVIELVPKNQINEDKDRRNQLEKASVSSFNENYVNPDPLEQHKTLLDKEFLTILNPQEQKTISGTLKFTDLDLPFNSSFKINIHLDLGYYHDQQNIYQTIQTREFTLQLAQDFQYREKSDFLLIVNSETKRELIEQIKEFASLYQSFVDIWNITNYQGFDFDFVGSSDSPFTQLYKNKVVIILGNSYDLPNGIQTNAVQQIGEDKIYYAAKYHGVGIYILGNGNYQSKWITNQNIKEAEKFQTETEKENEIYSRFKGKFEFDEDKFSQKQMHKSDIEAVKKNSSFQFNFKQEICCYQPEECEIKSKSNDIINRVQQYDKRHYYSVVYNFHPQVLENNFFTNLYSAGTIQVIEQLRKDQAQIIERPLNDDKLLFDQVDKFCLIKLLSFTQKLQYFIRSLNSKEKAMLIVECIFSDLADEYLAYHNAGIHPQKYAKYIQKWVQFNNFLLQNYFQAPQPNQNEQKQNLNNQYNLGQQYITKEKIEIRKEVQSKIYQFILNLKEQQSCFEVLFCCCSNDYQLTKYCIHVLNSLSFKLFQNKNLIESQNNELKKYNQYSQAQSLREFQQPYGSYKNVPKNGIQISNIYCESKVESHSRYNSFVEKKNQLNNIQEGQFYFINEETQQIDQQKRKNKISQFESFIKFEQ